MFHMAYNIGSVHIIGENTYIFICEDERMCFNVEVN